MKQRSPAMSALILTWITLQCPYAHAAADKPIPIAVIDLDFRDTSDEPTDQNKAHSERLRLFMEALRADLTRNGQFEVVELKCDPAPCSIEDSDSESLLNAAKAAGASLMLYGGIHKASTLIQFANVVVADVERDQVVARRSLSFRGDDDRSWQHAEKFVAKQLNEELAGWGR